MAHTYNTKQRQQDEETYQKTIRLEDFNQFLYHLNKITLNGQTEMNAVELIRNL
jgi:hypothetical protein